MIIINLNNVRIIEYIIDPDDTIRISLCFGTDFYRSFILKNDSYKDKVFQAIKNCNGIIEIDEEYNVTLLEE